MAELTCPKCGGGLRSYERNGVVIEQCADCRGIFLDRGELERLTTAEQTWYAEAGGPQQQHQPEPRHAPPPPPAPAPAYGRPDRDYRHDDRDHYGGGGHYPHHKRKKRKSFLSEMLDFD